MTVKPLNLVSPEHAQFGLAEIAALRAVAGDRVQPVKWGG